MSNEEDTKPQDNNAEAEEAHKKFEELSVDEKINVITQNAMSRQETYQRLDSILEKVQAIAVRVENIELKQRLAVAEGASE
jgi:hypothetical protein